MDYLPGCEAPEDGLYEQLNIFGLSTGITERVAKGERLPLAPQGYTWRKVFWTLGRIGATTCSPLHRLVGTADRTRMPQVPKPFVGRD